MAGKPPLLKRHVAAVVAGNALEFYDFLTFTFFAIYIGRAFFPSTSATTSLLATLAAFGVGFVTRPIGGFVLGIVGDRVGRRPAMFLSFSLIGIAIVGVALTPTYASIGVAAPILVVAFRLVQGFALGGEVGPTTAFLIEAPPARERGFYGSLQSASQYLSSFAAGFVGMILSLTLSPQDFGDWGWRVAFLIGAAAVPFGLLVRRTLPETMPAPEPNAERAGVLVRRHLGDAACGLFLLAHATICTYVILYLPTYAQHTLHMQATNAFAAIMVIGLTGAVSAALSGLVSDRVGRKPVMMVQTVILIAITIPAFMVLNYLRSETVLLGVAFVLTAVFAASGNTTIITTTELMPPRIRSAGTSVIYALAIAIFGGSAQYNVAALTDFTHDAIAPAYYMTVALVVGLIVMWIVRETAPAKRDR